MSCFFFFFFLRANVINPPSFFKKHEISRLSDYSVRHFFLEFVYDIHGIYQFRFYSFHSCAVVFNHSHVSFCCCYLLNNKWNSKFCLKKPKQRQKCRSFVQKRPSHAPFPSQKHFARSIMSFKPPSPLPLKHKTEAKALKLETDAKSSETYYNYLYRLT